MNKRITLLSILFLLISIGLHISKAFAAEDYNITYQYINTKDIAMASIDKIKEENNHSIYLLEKIDEWYLNTQKAEDKVFLFEAVSLPKNKINKPDPIPELTWHLPTEKGTISQYPSYSHPAYDITSPRGTSEIIFPVANGVISSIYTDNAGGLTITILHTASNGAKYTSKYVHMWRYADGLYVGKPVTINDALGWMGATGYATGTHLHLEVYECALFDATDSNCYDYNHYTRFAKARFSAGYRGLASHINVPYHWNNRDGS